ncbi:DUF5712 family protein [Pedobacter vanadiisoli]|uniref:DUF5712 family protein n=1 Tax=Pedobacter vanadiisoli TaxID=1761975 RepID=A0ABW5MHQ6_9SPHI
MYINITDSVTANNKGSSGELVSYLEKENRLDEMDGPEYWFNNNSKTIEPYEVRNVIDSNNAKLGKTDAKFFLINISPSQKELKYLLKEFGKEGMKKRLKLYAEKVMDGYAQNFKREGINSSKDLLWFGKIEHNRYYTYKDKEVISGEKKRGEIKAGKQMHIQIIVSRRDVSNRIKLSPMNNSRGRNIEHSKKLGQFDRVAFKQSGETLFDGLFAFDRKLDETFSYANILKNGSIDQKEQLALLETSPAKQREQRQIVNELAKEIAAGLFSSASQVLKVAEKRVSGFAQLMMEPVYPSVQEVYSIGVSEKRKRKKRRGQSQGLNR